MIFTFAGKGSKEFPHWAFEVWGPCWYRGKGRISLISFDADVSWRGDHAPSFYWHVSLLGFMLWEIHFYNTRHED